MVSGVLARIARPASVSSEGLGVTEAPKVSFPGVEIDLAKVVHGAQHVFPLGPIPASGTATTSS